jgi:hypothetical protein
MPEILVIGSWGNYLTLKKDLQYCRIDGRNHIRICTFRQLDNSNRIKDL